MERYNVTSAETLREKVPRMESSIWTACSRVATRSVQDPVVPQQGHVPRLQQAKGHETGRVRQRVVTDCGLATAGWKSFWKFLWRGSSHWQQTKGTGPGSGAGQAKAGAGPSIGAARRVHSHLGERGAGGGNGHETRSALGTENGPSTGPDFVELSNQERRRCKRCRRPRIISSKRSRR